MKASELKNQTSGPTASSRALLPLVGHVGNLFPRRRHVSSAPGRLVYVRCDSPMWHPQLLLACSARRIFASSPDPPFSWDPAASQQLLPGCLYYLRPSPGGKRPFRFVSDRLIHLSFFGPISPDPARNFQPHFHRPDRDKCGPIRLLQSGRKIHFNELIQSAFSSLLNLILRS
jgi:hypothetical protein